MNVVSFALAAFVLALPCACGGKAVSDKPGWRPTSGGSTSGGSTSGDVITGETSWDTTLSLTGTGATAGGAVGCEVTLTMHLSADDTGIDALFARDGRTSEARLLVAEQPVRSYALDGGVIVPTESTTCVALDVRVASLVLIGRDTNRDGRVDLIEGAGKATGYSSFHDEDGTSLDVQLVAVPDVTAPSFLLEPDLHDPSTP